MDTEQGQTKTNQDQLLEIYKLHAQLASDISNRLTTNRFYPTLMSGSLAIFFAALQRADVLFPQETDNPEQQDGHRSSHGDETQAI